MHQNPPPVKYWEIIADNLSRAAWTWGCVSAVDSNGRTIWIADAHRDDGKRFVAEIKYLHARAEGRLKLRIHSRTAPRIRSGFRAYANFAGITRKNNLPEGAAP